MAQNLLVPVNFQTNPASVRRLQALLNQLQQPINKKISFSGSTQPLGTISKNLKEIDKSLDAATARVLAFGGTVGIIGGVGAAFKRIGRDFINVEHALAQIQALTKSTTGQMKSLATEAFGLANKLSVPFEDVAEGLQEFARQGLNAEKSLKATSAATIIAKLSGTNLKQAIDGLIATTNSFTNELQDYSDVANKLVAVDARFATSAGGLIEGIKRVGSVASDAGVSLDKTVAAIAAIKQISGRSEAVIGNGLKTIFTNLQTEKVQESLNQLGIATKDANGEFLDSITILQQLSGTYDKLTDSQRAAVSLKIAGKFQINTLKSFLTSLKGGNTGVFGSALDTSENAGDEAQARIDILNKTTKSGLVRLQNDVTETFAAVGERIAKPLIDAFTTATKVGLDVLKVGFGDNVFGNIVSKGLAGALSGPGVVAALALVIKLVKRIGVGFAQGFSSLSGIGKGTNDITRANQILLGVLQAQNEQRVRALSLTQALAGASVAATRTGASRSVLPGGSLPVGGITRTTNGAPSVPRPVTRQDVLASAQRDSARQLQDERRLIAIRQQAAAKESIRQEGIIAKQQRAQRINNIAFGAGFAFPLLGAAASETVGGSKTRGGRLTQDVGNSLGTGAVLAALTSSLLGGPGAIAAGAGIAGLQIASGFKREEFNPDEFVKAFENSQSKLTGRQNSIQAFIESLSTVDSLQESGASLRNIGRARSQSTDSFSGLDPEDAFNIGKFQGNREKIGEYLQDLTRTQGKAVLLQGVNKRVAELSAEKNSGLFGGGGRLGADEAKTIANGIVGSIDTSKISGSKLLEIGNRNNVTRGDLINDLQLDANQVNKIFEQLTKGFEGAEKDLGPIIAKILRTLGIGKQLTEEQEKLGKFVDKVSVNVKGLTRAVFEQSNSENARRQLGIQGNLGFAKNTIDFQSSQGFLTDEGAGYASRKIAEVELANKNNQELREASKDLVKLVEEAASGLTDPVQKLAALDILKQYNTGGVSLGGLSDRFNELGAGFSKNDNVESIFSAFNDKSKEATRALSDLANQGELNAQLLQHANDLERQKIDNAMLLQGAGVGRSAEDTQKLFNDFLAKLGQRILPNQGDANVPISQSNAALAQARLAQLDAEQQLGLSSIPDSELTPNQILLKRRQEEERIEAGKEAYGDIIGETNRSLGVSKATQLLDAIDGKEKGILDPSKRKEILEAINSGSPRLALNTLLKETTPLFGNDPKKTRLSGLAQPLNEFLQLLEAKRSVEDKSAEVAARKRFPTSEVNEETKRQIAEAERLKNEAQTSLIKSGIDGSSKMGSIDSHITQILDSLNRSQVVASAKTQLGSLAQQQADVEKKLSDSFDPLKPDTYRVSKRGFGGAPTAIETGIIDSNDRGDSHIVPIKQAQEFFDTSKENVRTLSNQGLSADDIKKAVLGKKNDVAVDAGTLEKMVGGYIDEIVKLRQILEQKAEKEKTLDENATENKTSAQINLDLSIDATPDLIAALSGDSFKEGVTELVRNEITKSYVATNGKRPVFTPATTTATA